MEKLSQSLDVEKWRSAPIPAHFQLFIDDFINTKSLADSAPLIEFKNAEAEITRKASEVSRKDSEAPTNLEILKIGDEKFTTVQTALLMLEIMAQFSNVLRHFKASGPELLMHIVSLLKHFNSRTCQLILGAGALKLVGLKTISVKTLGK